jgi:hypothetical protein
MEKRGYINYTETDLREALRLIKGGEVTIRKASEITNVPRSTIQNKKKTESNTLKRIGRPPKLAKDILVTNDVHCNLQLEIEKIVSEMSDGDVYIELPRKNVIMKSSLECLLGERRILSTVTDFFIKYAIQNLISKKQKRSIYFSDYYLFTVSKKKL